MSSCVTDLFFKSAGSVTLRSSTHALHYRTYLTNREVILLINPPSCVTEEGGLKGKMRIKYENVGQRFFLSYLLLSPKSVPDNHFIRLIRKFCLIRLNQELSSQTDGFGRLLALGLQPLSPWLPPPSIAPILRSVRTGLVQVRVRGLNRETGFKD